MKSASAILLFLCLFCVFRCYAADLRTTSQSPETLYQRGTAGDATAFADLLIEAQHGDKEAQDQITKHSLMTFLKPLADKGDTKAEYEVGLLYEYGWGVTQDYTESMKWLSDSAKKGNIDAQRFLLRINRDRDDRAARDEHDASISRALYLHNQLWLLSDKGDVSRIKEGGNNREQIALPEPAVDLWKQQSTVAVSTCKPKNCVNWKVLQWNQGKWVESATINTQGDAYIGVGGNGSTLVVLTSSRIIEVADNSQKVTTLSETLKSSLVTSLFVTSDYILVGKNSGEWGGGLLRADRKSGVVSHVEGSLIRPSLDPVNAIVSEPWKPACAVAAIGMIHVYSQGGLVEICGNTMRQVYSKHYGDTSRPTKQTEQRDELSSTVAFFGLIGRRNVLWGVSVDGIYRIHSDGTAEVQPLPSFQNVGGVKVNFDIPDVVLILTTINQRHSLSGPVPLIVPR